MIKLVVCISTFGFAGYALGQALPAPQFATPPALDSSSRAATTSWVRSQNLLSATGDVSQATVRPTGAAIARTAAARAADTFNVLDYGAVADGVTDIGPALAAIAAKLNASAPSNVVYFPAGSYRLATPVTFSGVAPILQGQGFTQGPPLGGTGTWIKVDSAGATPITFSGTNSRGAQVRDVAFYEVHPSSVVGWTPSPNDYVFKVLNALGEVKFDNVLFAGVNRGIYASNSGRLNIRDVQGQFYTTGIEIDDCYDIPRIQRLHSWNFLTSDTNVMNYQTANQDTVLLRRVDGIFIGDLFSIAAHNVLHLSSGVHGVTTKAYASHIYADLSVNGLLIDGPGSTIQIANMTSQGNDPTNGGSLLPNSHAVWVNANGVVAQISNLASSLTAGSAVQVDRYGNNISISNLNSRNWGISGANTPAVFVSDSATNPPNNVYIGNKELLQGSGGQPLYNTSTNGGRERFVMMNDAGGPSPNEVRAYSATPGNPPQFAAIGGDTDIDVALTGKGAKGVRLQSSGQTVLRVDNANGSGNDVLLRGGASTLNWIAEGADANIDVGMSGKGSSGVRLQSSGQTILRVDNANSSGNDLLVRGGSSALNLIGEGSDSSIDLNLTSKGTGGGVRMWANGATVLRLDNPNAVADDMLVRASVAAVNVIAEGTDPSIDIFMTSKGPSGGVRLQGNGNTVLRVDNLAGSSDDLLVRGGAGSLNLTAEGPEGAVDLLLTSIGAAGSTRLQANGSTVLRVDSPSGGNSNLLVRSSTAVTSLTVESASSAASLALNPKGSGVVTAPTALSSDNSSTIATTAFVKSQGFIGSGGAPVQSVNGNTGAVNISAAGLGAAAAANPVLTGTTTVSGFNGILLSGAPVANAPSIAASGLDAAVSLAFKTQGGGVFTFSAGAGASILNNPAGGIQLTGGVGAGTTLGSNGSSGSPVVIRGGRQEQGYTYQNAGASYTFVGNTDRLILGIGATSPFNLTMPPAPADGQVEMIECDASFTLSLAASAGQTLGGTAVSCGPTQGHQWHYRSTDSRWRMDY